MNTVLIPCFSRPEFLTVALEQIVKAQGAEEHHYIFRLDHGYKSANLKVIEGFPYSHELSFTPPTRYKLAKQSYSVLTGLIYAASKSDGLVFLIEDDVMIGRDFFLWHEWVHAHEHLFSSHGNLNINDRNPPQGEHDQYYLTTNAYGSIGTCLPAAIIRNRIQPHANHEYYSRPVEYCAATFPDSTLGRDYAEQDGLIRRIQERDGTPQAYPCHKEGPLSGPRCFHAGFYGKNRPKAYPGNLERCISRVREVVFSDTNMRNFALHEYYYADSRPCELELPRWTKLRSLTSEAKKAAQ